MTLIFHPSNSRGHANHGWLEANHSFSFAAYYDPSKTNFGALRVLNDDKIAPSMGFGTHPHNNMEIITVPLFGVLKHKDSMSNEWLKVEAGEVQVMSAGTGVFHSEMNASSTEDLKLFQIWISPNLHGVAPRYDQRHYEQAPTRELQLLVESIDDFKLETSLKINQNAQISRINLNPNDRFTYYLKSEAHGVYVMQVFGISTIGNHKLQQRDAVGVSNATQFLIEAQQESQLLFIEVPMVF
jgi:redox-sensitive bicupin YhaK (pirin superfamily)